MNTNEVTKLVLSNLLDNKVIIIAGGLGLIGRVFVDAVVEKGGTAVIADIDESRRASFVSSLKSKWGKDVLFCKVDTTKKQSILDMINFVAKRYGKIDAVVNATYPRNKNWGRKFEEVTYEDFCENINLHLGSYFLLSQQMALYFERQGYGNLVNIASIQGVTAPKFDTYEGIQINGRDMTSPVEYAAIKASIIHLTRYMAKYFKEKNIRFNCISPGGILDNQPEEFVTRYRKYCTSKGMLDPADLKGTLVYLLSDMSQYVNGQNMIVDDGWVL